MTVIGPGRTHIECCRQWSLAGNISLVTSGGLDVARIDVVAVTLHPTLKSHSGVLEGQYILVPVFDAFLDARELNMFFVLAGGVEDGVCVFHPGLLCLFDVEELVRHYLAAVLAVSGST